MVIGYGISLGVSQNRPFAKVLIMPTNSEKHGGHMKGFEFALLALGAVAGAFVRYKMAESPLMLGTLPINILIINVVGSFILGIFSIMLLAWNLDARYSLLVAIGFCGSLTTMSSFALETSTMIDNRQFGNVALNIIANVGLSIAGIFAGRASASLFVKATIQSG